MATDVTVRRRVAHRITRLFGKLSHQLSAVTTASEAAMFICEAADELFHWDDFALDLYSAEKDEVVSLLTITTVEGQRVEIPASLQPKTANALVRRVITRGAELIRRRRRGTARRDDDRADPQRRAGRSGCCSSRRGRAHSYADATLETLQTLADQCGGALQRVRAEEELRHSQQRFRDLFENSPDAIFVEDLTGQRVGRESRRRASCTESTREQLIGKNAMDDLVPPASREAARGRISKAGEPDKFPGWKAKACGRTAGPCRSKSASCASNSTASPRCCFMCATSASGARRRWRCAVRRHYSVRSGKIPWTACG